MKKLLLALILLCSIVIISFTQFNSGIGYTTVKPTVAPAIWFEGPTTEAPSDVVPFNKPNVNDTSFHLWAWQQFLHLTRSKFPRAPFEGLLFQVDTAGKMVYNPNTFLVLTDSLQAVSHLPLYDTNHIALLYSIQVNTMMYHFMQTYLPMFKRIITNCWKHKWSPDGRIDSMAIDKNIQDSLNIRKLSNLNFPVGALVIKTSWIRAYELGKDSVNYYITNANVLNGKGKPVVERVALTGMHVVGRLDNHPEFIWATFEHDNLAPQYPWTNSWPQDTTTLIVSNKNYLFYHKNTPIGKCLNETECTANKFTNAFNMFPLGEALSFVFTKNTSDTTFPSNTPSHLPTNLDIIDSENSASLNASVHAHLLKVSGPWSHYFYKGSVWINSPNKMYYPGNGNIYVLTDTYLRGARALSNITMETYTQIDFSGIYNTGSMSCFGCHSTADFNNVAYNNDSLSYNLTISHLFRNSLTNLIDSLREGKKRQINPRLPLRLR